VTRGLVAEAATPPTPVAVSPQTKSVPPTPKSFSPNTRTIEATPSEPSGQSEKTKAALAAAAIAAAIVQESRNAYYATGRPCACPDDHMRNGRACGGNSAYLRPGGAAPLCYVGDVKPEKIEEYRRQHEADR